MCSLLFNETIREIICSFLGDIRDLWHLSITCKAHWLGYAKQRYLINIVSSNVLKHLSRFHLGFFSLRHFDELLNDNRLVLSGSFALYCCLGNESIDWVGDIDLFHDPVQPFDVCDTFVSQRKIILQLSYFGFVLTRKVSHDVQYLFPVYADYYECFHIMYFEQVRRNRFGRFITLQCIFTNHSAIDVIKTFDYKFVMILYRNSFHVEWVDMVSVITMTSEFNPIIINQLILKWESFNWSGQDVSSIRRYLKRLNIVEEVSALLIAVFLSFGWLIILH
jgi:hypothetical protein